MNNLPNLAKPTCLLAAICLLLTTLELKAATVTIVPPGTPMLHSTQFSVDVVINDLQIDENVAEFEFNLGYDPDVLTFNQVTFGQALGNPGPADNLFTFVEDFISEVNVLEISSIIDLSQQPDSFTLASVQFTTLMTGASALTINNPVFIDDVFTSISVKTSPESITVIPLPPAWIMFGTGLLLCFRKTKQKTQFFR